MYILGPSRTTGLGRGGIPAQTACTNLCHCQTCNLASPVRHTCSNPKFMSLSNMQPCISGAPQMFGPNIYVTVKHATLHLRCSTYMILGPTIDVSNKSSTGEIYVHINCGAKNYVWPKHSIGSGAPEMQGCMFERDINFKPEHLWSARGARLHV